MEATESKERLKKIFNLAEQAHNHLFVREISQEYKIQKQKFFPKGATVVWKPFSVYDKTFTACANCPNLTISIFFPSQLPPG